MVFHLQFAAGSCGRMQLVETFFNQKSIPTFIHMCFIRIFSKYSYSRWFSALQLDSTSYLNFFTRTAGQYSLVSLPIWSCQCSSYEENNYYMNMKYRINHRSALTFQCTYIFWIQSSLLPYTYHQRQNIWT